MTPRFLPASLMGAATLAAAAGAIFGGAAAPTLILVAVGAPLTALLLATASSGQDYPLSRLALSLIVGATAAPAAVLALHAALAAAVYGLVAPLAEAGRSLLDELRADPTLLAVLSSPWAFFFLVDLAVVAPLTEELLKPLGSALRRLRSPLDAFLCGAAAGAGFAAAENILYASGGWYSNDAWVAISLARSVGAAVHVLGTALVTLGIYRIRQEHRPFRSLLRLYAAAAAVHAVWNGTIAVTIILFNERQIVAGGLGGTALSWGITLQVALAALGMLTLGALVAVARRLGRGASVEETWLSLSRPADVAGWSALAAALLIPVLILLLAFPDFLAL